MVKFNPDVPDINPPSYLGLSKPIETPASDKTAATALEGLSTGLTGAVKLTDTLIKKDIDNQVYAQIDSERDAYTKTLQDVRNSVTEAPPVYAPLSIIPDENGNIPIPDRIEKSLGYARSLKGAYDAGKVPPTYYTANLMKVAADIRNQYPGYREYIDKQIKEVTGVDPGNEMIKNLQSEINRSQTSKKDFTDKIESDLRKMASEGDNAAVDVWRGFTQGIISPEKAVAWMSLQNKGTYDLKEAQRAAATIENNFKASKIVAQDNANAYAATRAATHFNALTFNLTGGEPQKVSVLMQTLLENPNAISDQDAARLAQRVMLSKQDYINNLRKEFNTPITDLEGKPIKGARTVSQQMGGSADTEKLIAENAAVFDQVYQHLMNKEYGFAFDKASRNERLVEAAKNRVYTDPKIGDQILHMTVLEKATPALAQDIAVNAFRNQFPNAIQDFMRERQASLMTQTGAKQGKIETFSDSLDKTKDLKVVGGKYYNFIADTIEYLSPTSKASDSDKVNLARAAYDPRNLTYLSKIDPTTRDEKGRTVPGRTEIFAKFTTEERLKEVKRLAASNPELWDDARQWIYRSLGNDIFRNSINNFREVQNFKDKDGYPMFSFSYKDGQFAFKANDYGNPLHATQTAHVNFLVNDLNKGLKGLRNFYKEDGQKDIDGAVLKLFMDYGKVDLTNNVDGVPEELLRSLFAAKAGAEGEALSRKAPGTFMGKPNYDTTDPSIDSTGGNVSKWLDATSKRFKDTTIPKNR